jgi:hypothetical protein
MKKFFLPLIIIAFSSVFEFANAQVSITAVSSKNITCNGGNDGYINVNVVEDDPYYSINGYYWSNGARTENISGLTAGTYTLTATDNWSMSSTYSLTLTQPDAFAANAVIVGDTSTVTAPSGSINPQISGGTSPYNYFWSTMATTDSVSGLTNGSYSLTVTDSKACVSQALNFTVGLATGIQNVTGGNNHFTLYPNPATGYLTVNIPSSSINRVDITDVLGHTVYTNTVTDKQIAIDISSLAPGIYFAVLRTAIGSSAGVNKFIKE